MASGTIIQEIKTYTSSTMTINITANSYGEFVFDLTSLNANQILGVIVVNDQAATTGSAVRRITNNSLTVQVRNVTSQTLTTGVYVIVTYR